MKAKKQKIGYLFIYESKPLPGDIEFAKFHNIKLTPYINIYSKYNDILAINKILHNRGFWPFDNELKYMKYEYVKTIEILNSKLLAIRQSTFWHIEKREIPDFINNENIITYTCFTNVHYLKYLNKKYKTKQWVFSDVNKRQSHPLKNVLHYNKLIRKGRVVVTNPVVARQCIQRRNKKGHTVEYITNKTFIKKDVTKPKDIRKPYDDKLVCLTDGITVIRISRFEAEERIARYPTLHYCTKAEYYKYLNEMRGPKPEVLDKKPKLSVQGSKQSINVETGKKTDVRTRRERRVSLQKNRKTSRFYKSQFVTGKWVPDADGEHESFVETGNVKRISHRMKPEKYTKPWYNPLKRKQAIPYEEEQKLIKRIKINKFPYNKEIVVVYKSVGEDDVVTNKQLEHCKMLNNRIIQEQPTKRTLKNGTEIDDTEQIVICSLKDVDKWCHQEDFKGPDTDIKWIPYISIETDTKVIKHKPVFKLLRKPKKTKKWHSPTKQGWWERRGLPPF
jgi:hypothetical protein